MSKLVSGLIGLSCRAPLLVALVSLPFVTVMWCCSLPFVLGLGLGGMALL